MTNFLKHGFYKSSGYLHYGIWTTEELPEGAKGLAGLAKGAIHGKFVARFKYQKGGIGSFQTFLMKNFTVEEYFGRLAAGETPLAILESKGYMLPHIKKWLKAGGYPVNQVGFKAFCADQAKRSQARLLETQAIRNTNQVEA